MLAEPAWSEPFNHLLDSTVVCVMSACLVNFASGILTPTKSLTATIDFTNVILTWFQELSHAKVILCYLKYGGFLVSQ